MLKCLCVCIYDSCAKRSLKAWHLVGRPEADECVGEKWQINEIPQNRTLGIKIDENVFGDK